MGTTVLQKKCLSGCQTSPLYAHLSDVGNVRENINHLNSSRGLFLILCATTFIFCGMNINTANTVEKKKFKAVIHILSLDVSRLC